jgi:hypothetical protein
MLKVAAGEGAYGARLITTEPIRAGEPFSGIERYRVVREATYQTIQIGRHEHVEELSVLAYMNHSCRPNVVVHTGHLRCYATRDVGAGDELTFFYPSTEWDMARPFVCRCGAPECIQLVAGARYLSLNVLSRYFVNQHIHQFARESLRSELWVGQGVWDGAELRGVAEVTSLEPSDGRALDG